MADKPKRQSWRKWVPNAEAPVLITRAELLAKAERLGLKLDYSTLRYWESEGVIPAPEVEKNGTPGRYPWWVIDVVYQVRRLQDEGLALDDIRHWVRWRARYFIAPSSPADLRSVVLGEGYQPTEPVDPGPAFAYVAKEGAPDLAPPAYAIAAHYAESVGTDVAAVSLLITTTDGAKFAISLERPTLANPASENE